MKKDTYVYSSIFHYEETGVSISFPDIPECISYGNDELDAIQMATEALELHLFGLEEEGFPFPIATKPNAITVGTQETLQLIKVYMPIVREYMNRQAVNKTLTIPRWMDTQIKQQEGKVNLSGILQDSLVQLFGLKNPLYTTNEKEKVGE